MAIGRIAGQMLYSNLERQGVDLAFDSNLVYLDVNNRRVGFNTTSPTDTLTVIGNVNATAYVGTSFASTGNITASGNVNASQGYFTNDVTVLGNLYTTLGNVYSNAGVFYGNSITGAGALYAGIPSGYTLLPNVVSQFTGNANTYVQLNAQNINSGNQATTDYVATANNGTDTVYYIDLGIAGNNYDNSNPNNSLGTSLYSNDAYLYTQGNTGATGGNLVIGTSTPSKVIRFIAGGVNEANVISTFSPTQIVINATTPSTSYGSGALVVNGGVGIEGNLNVHGYTSVDHLVVNGGDFTNVNLGNISFSNTTISTTLVNGNVTIAPTGTGLVYINTNTALSIPYGNTSQEPSNAPQGSIRYNTDTSSLEFFNGTSWIQTTSTFDTQTINPDGVNQTYTLIRTTDSAGILVMLNGVMQLPDVAYTVVTDQITFAEVPQPTDVIDIRFVATGELASGDLRASPNATYVNTSATIIDSYDITLYRSAKYIVQVSDTANVKYQTSEVLMTHDGSSTIISVYGTVLTSTNLVGFTSTITSGYAQLKATSATANCAVKIQKTYIST